MHCKQTIKSSVLRLFGLHVSDLVQVVPNTIPHLLQCHSVLTFRSLHARDDMSLKKSSGHRVRRWIAAEGRGPARTTSFLLWQTAFKTARATSLGCQPVAVVLSITVGNNEQMRNIRHRRSQNYMHLF